VSATLYAFSTDKAVKVTSTNTSVTVPALGYEIFTATAVK
jgi:hypothetical protein